MGLQPSEDLRNGGVAVEGAFHPAFRELVDGEIYFDFLKKIKEKDGILSIKVNEKNVSKIVGIKKKNSIRFGKFQLDIDNCLDASEIVVNNKKYNRKDILKEELSDCR